MINGNFWQPWVSDAGIWQESKPWRLSVNHQYKRNSPSSVFLDLKTFAVRCFLLHTSGYCSKACLVDQVFWAHQIRDNVEKESCWSVLTDFSDNWKKIIIYVLPLCLFFYYIRDGSVFSHLSLHFQNFHKKIPLSYSSFAYYLQLEDIERIISFLTCLLNRFWLTKHNLVNTHWTTI